MAGIGGKTYSHIYNPFILLILHTPSFFKSLITFTENVDHNVVNLSRANPANFVVMVPTAGNYKSPYLCFKDKNTPALCITFGMVAKDSIQVPMASLPGQTWQSKLLTVVPLSLEIERKIATICVIINRDSYACRMNSKELEFSTVPRLIGMLYTYLLGFYLLNSSSRSVISFQVFIFFLKPIQVWYWCSKYCNEGFSSQGFTERQEP